MRTQNTNRRYVSTRLTGCRLKAWVAALLFCWSVNTLRAGELARGGGMPSVATIVDQYEQLISQGKRQEGIDKVIRFATQPRRDKNDRLKLFLTLTENAIEEKNNEEYLQILSQAKRYEMEFGHYLTLHHFYYDPAKPDIVNSIIWLAQHQSPNLKNVRVRFIWRIYHYIEDIDADKAFQLLEGLFNFGFPKDYRALSIDSLYLELIQRYLERDQLELAKRVLKSSITDLNVYFMVWHDNRFKKLWPLLENEGEFNPVKITQRNIQMAMDYLQSDKEKNWNQWIETKTQIVSLYRSLGLYEKAIEYANEAIEEVPESVKDEDHFYWLRQELIHVYDDSGYWLQAKELSEKVISEDIVGNPTLINGHINYAISLLENDELAYAEIIANRIVNDFAGYTSDYGEYFAKAVLVCVRSLTGKKVAARKLFQAMKQKAQTNYYATTRAALCLKDSKAVSELYLERLRDPGERAETLSYLSQYSARYSDDKNRELLLFRENVIHRRALQNAIKRYGRISRWSLPSGYWDGL